MIVIRICIGRLLRRKDYPKQLKRVPLFQWRKRTEKRSQPSARLKSVHYNNRVGMSQINRIS